MPLDVTTGIKVGLRLGKLARKDVPVRNIMMNSMTRLSTTKNNLKAMMSRQRQRTEATYGSFQKRNLGDFSENPGNNDELTNQWSNAEE